LLFLNRDIGERLQHPEPSAAGKTNESHPAWAKPAQGARCHCRFAGVMREGRRSQGVEFKDTLVLFS